MSIETLKLEIKFKSGKRYFTIDEICRVITNLGFYIHQRKAYNIFRKSVNLQEFGIDPTKHHLSKKVALYSQDVVWKYLKKLERKHKINLVNFNIRNIEDIVSMNLHEEENYENYGLKKVSEKDIEKYGDFDPDEYDGQVDNIIRAYDQVFDGF